VTAPSDERTHCGLHSRVDPADLAAADEANLTLFTISIPPGFAGANG
jgi:hypothetical protein